MMYTFFSSLTMSQFSDHLHLKVLTTEKSLILFRHHALLGATLALLKISYLKGF